MEKKYVSLSTLQKFLEKLKDAFASVLHTHSYDDLQDKPFYEVKNYISVFENGTTTLNFNKLLTTEIYFSSEKTTKPLNESTDYKVIWDGTEYDTTSTHLYIEDVGEVIVIGDSSNNYSEYPFMIYTTQSEDGSYKCFVGTNSTAPTHSVDILESIPEFVTINDNFISDNIARTEDHNIKTYTSLGQIGLSDDEMSEADALANFIKIFKVMNNYEVFCGGLASTSNLCKSILLKLADDLRINLGSYLDIQCFRSGDTGLQIDVEPRLYSGKTNYPSSKKYSCSLRYTKATESSNVIEYLSPFTITRTFDRFSGAGDRPLASDVGTLFINQKSHVDEMIAVAKSYYDKDAEYYAENGKYYFNYGQDYTCFSNSFGSTDTANIFDTDTPDDDKICNKNYIDCAAYIGLILRGIPFEKSPYALTAEERKNWNRDNIVANTEDYCWAMNPFDWRIPRKTHPVYNDFYYKPRVASQLARLLSAMGCSVMFDDKFSNVEAGDIIFVSRDTSVESKSGAFEHITHVVLCAGKEEVSDGDTAFTGYPYKHLIYDSTIINNDASQTFFNNRYLETTTSKVILICRPNLSNIYGNIKPIKEGGTGASTPEDARYAMNFIGTNPLTNNITNATIADDNPANWIGFGTGYAYITSVDQALMPNFPETYACYIHNYVYGSTVYQTLYPLTAKGTIYHRGGGALSGWYGDGKWQSEATQKWVNEQLTPFAIEVSGQTTELGDEGNVEYISTHKYGQITAVPLTNQIVVDCRYELVINNPIDSGKEILLGKFNQYKPNHTVAIAVFYSGKTFRGRIDTSGNIIVQCNENLSAGTIYISVNTTYVSPENVEPH